MMYIKYRKIIIAIISLLLGNISVSQAQNSILSPTFPTIIPQTPEVTKIMGMINYPVSYNTGTVKTEIPLYEIKLLGGYTLPIKLVYQSSGFKPRERSNVGVGWTLIAEPQIAHVVNGLPDEDRNGLYVNKGLNVNWTSVEHPYPESVYVDMAYGRYDIEPDQYFYQLPNKGGSFFLSRNPSLNDRKEFVTVPYDPIRVKDIDNLKNFQLADIDGVEYNFIPIEKTHTVSSEASTYTDAITMYKADRIRTPNNETINFFYEDEPHITRISNYEQSARLDIKSTANPGFQIPYCAGGENILTDEALAYKGDKYGWQVKLQQDDVYEVDAKVTKYHVFESDGVKNNDIFEMCDYRSTNFWQQSISTKKLSKIYFHGGSVEFIYSKSEGNYTLEKVLSGIIIKNGEGDIIKEFHLVTELSGTERPYLKEVRILSNDGLSHRKYSFQYYNHIGIAYDSPEVNVWGYYHYQEKRNQMYIPKLHARFALFSKDNGMVRDSMNFCFGKDDYYRDANTDIVNTTFMLKSITYPTGGRTDFIYEYGKFYENLRRKDVTTGCLRIKEIKNYQSNNILSSRRLFKYGKDESGLGLPVRLLKDSDFMTSFWEETYIIPPDISGVLWFPICKMYKVDIHARPLVNDFLDASASIVYDQVTEYTDEYGKSGKTVYEYDYSNLQNVQSERIIESYPLQPIMHKEAFKKYREWSTGQLVRKSIYDGNGDLLHTEENTYLEKEGDYIYRMIIYPHMTHFYSDSSVRNWEMNRMLKAGVETPSPVDSNPIPKGFSEAYQYDGRLSFRTGCKLLHSKITTDYKSGKAISDTTKYSYNDQLLPTHVIHTINNGKTKSETFSYPTDFTDEVSAAMVNKHILSPVIRHTTKNGNASYDVYTPYRMQSDLPVIDRIETGKDDNERETRIRFSKYDSYGNLLEAVKDNDLTVAYLYGYNSLYPVVKIEGAGYDYFSEEQGHLENNSDSIALVNKCTSLRNNLHGVGLVTSYTYEPLIGITSVTQPYGDRTSYGYNNFGELISETNVNGEKEKQYDYYYKYNGNQSPLTVSISSQDMYYLGTYNFSATSWGGMGGYKYQWFLTDGENINYQSIVSTSEIFQYKFTQTGNYKLTCRVEDFWGHSSSTTVEFQVKLDLRIQFENMNYFTDGNEKFMEANIKCAVETNIIFRLVYNADTIKGVTYWINEKEFHGKGNGMQEVTVKFPKGSSRIYIMAPVSTPFYYIEMIGADAGTSIQYPFIMMSK